MKIGSYETKGNVFLAPMAGITDFPFRLMCYRYGASLTYTEMINAKALCYEDENTWKMLKIHPEEGDIAIQIFGSEPAFIGKAAKIIQELKRFVLIDINMGCPAPKVVKNGDGSALMREMELAYDVVRAAKENTTLPVTVKFRKGWDNEHVNALEFAKQMERAGADAITVHGRTREQYYSGVSDWTIIKQIVEAVKIPVIGNGDIKDRESFEEKTAFSNVQAVMIGRAAQGNPFLFNHLAGKGPDKKDIPYAEIYRVIKEHYDLEVQYKGEDKAVREMRKHIGWYIKGLPMAAKVRNEINNSVEVQRVFFLLDEYFDHLTETV